MEYKVFHLLGSALQLKWETRKTPTHFNRPSRKCNSINPQILYCLSHTKHTVVGMIRTQMISCHTLSRLRLAPTSSRVRGVCIQWKLILTRISSPKLGRLEYYFLQFYMLKLNSAQPPNSAFAYNEEKWKVFCIYTNFRSTSYSAELKGYNAIRRKIIKFVWIERKTWKGSWLAPTEARKVNDIISLNSQSYSSTLSTMANCEKLKLGGTLVLGQTAATIEYSECSELTSYSKYIYILPFKHMGTQMYEPQHRLRCPECPCSSRLPRRSTINISIHLIS